MQLGHVHQRKGGKEMTGPGLTRLLVTGFGNWATTVWACPMTNHGGVVIHLGLGGGPLGCLSGGPGLQPSCVPLQWTKQAGCLPPGPGQWAAMSWLPIFWTSPIVNQGAH